MKLYKIKAERVVQQNGAPSTDSRTFWLGSQSECAGKRKELLADGFKRVEIETDEHDIPTDKTGLLAYLNSQET